MEDNTWTAPRRALWQRLHQYDFGGEQHEAFLTRIARVCQTTREGAQAALDEYRRFCFLAVAAGHAVTPSELVDQVWHAHMTDTRDYWQRFCPQVLEQSLHHAPSLGGAEEQARHEAQYRDTYRSYELFFSDPPAAQWPPPRPTAPVESARPLPTPFVTPWHDTPRGTGKWCWFWSVACAATYMLGAATQGGFDPLEWRGGAFLGLYFTAIACVFTVGGALQRALRGRNRRGAEVATDPIELGFLAGGPERAADVAIVELLARDAFVLDYQGSAAQAVQGQTGVWLRATPNGGERDVPDSLRVAAWTVQRRQSLGEALSALKQHYAGLADSMRAKGWWLSHDQDWRVRVVGAVPMIALAGFGLNKISIGLSRERPVGFLVVLVSIAGLLALGRLLFPQQRSRAGDWALHDATRDLAEREDVGARVALMGTLGLAGSGLFDYHVLRTPVSSSSSSDSGSGSSGSCSGGGDGGGGGGCGGCGGGGD